MNIHSYIMARTIDNTKLEGIKQSAIKLIVEKGYGGASISSIAKKAKVAEGYLYRFYKSKEELVSDLLNSKITEIANNLDDSIQKSESVAEIINLLVNGIFKISENSLNDIKFLYVMMNDYSFSISSTIKDRIALLCREIIEKGKSLNQLNELISEEEIYMFLVIYPIQFINLRNKKFFGLSKYSKDDIDRLKAICRISLLKK